MEDGGSRAAHGAYGAPNAGGSFDLVRFLRQPQTVTRIVSAVFALIVFSCIISEGYFNPVTESATRCKFNENEDACRYGIGIGVLAFLGCIFFFVIDIYFPQLSSATDRRYIVMGDLGFSCFWSFLWFVGFCFLTHEWSVTPRTDPNMMVVDGVQAAIAFNFFSILSWIVLSILAYKRYKIGVDDFTQSYADPTQDSTIPPYPNVGGSSYQQPPFSNNPDPSDGYQPPTY
ncbi:synaptogyrin-2 [Ambystoma mexicanum]|uniref:synaptogyrin-2 n=1 Tax=Ambystoma mexicanum TaxID=8296 RepID=UPI0037E90C71